MKFALVISERCFHVAKRKINHGTALHACIVHYTHHAYRSDKNCWNQSVPGKTYVVTAEPRFSSLNQYNDLQHVKTFNNISTKKKINEVESGFERTIDTIRLKNKQQDGIYNKYLTASKQRFTWPRANLAPQAGMYHKRNGVSSLLTWYWLISCTDVMTRTDVKTHIFIHSDKRTRNVL